MDRRVADLEDFAIDALAVARLTRLVTKDRITRPVREVVTQAAYGFEWPTGIPRNIGRWEDAAKMDPDPPAVAVLVRCPWCVGMWISLGVTVLRAAAPRTWRYLARALAASQLAGYGANLDIEG